MIYSREQFIVKLILKTEYYSFIVIIISTFALIHKNNCILYAK